MANATVTVKASGGDYTTLNAALAGEAADLTANCHSTGGAGILTIECYAMADTTAASTGTGYTTSADYYINITVPASERHDGKWNTSKYRLAVTAWADSLDVQEQYTRVDGLQISGAHTSGAGSGIYEHGGGNITVTNCIITRTATASRTIGLRLGANSRVYNCVIYTHTIGINVSWTSPSGTSYLYNNTISDCNTTGISTDVGTHNITNCAVFNTADDFANANGTNNITYCASDDGDGTNVVDISPGETEADDWANAFVDYANGDFHVKDTNSVLYNAGTDLSGTFTTDIDGDTRSQWDIGADEYVAAGGADEYVGVGGAVAGGTISPANIAIYTTSGGAVSGDSATLSIICIPAVSGGGVSGGTVAILSLAIVSGDGGGEAGGESPVELLPVLQTLTVSMSGGAVASDSFGLVTIAVLASSGGAVAGGLATYYRLDINTIPGSLYETLYAGDRVVGISSVVRIISVEAQERDTTIYTDYLKVA